jgi:hypothetical protein
MIPELDTPTDALPLLAYKIAPRQFDLSYRFSNISLRDQIVRAQTLVRTLLATGLVAPGKADQNVDFPLLICGAGAAGLAAAKEADALGIRFVLIEKGDVVPGGVLNKDADRYVSTAMYEWPLPNHMEHAYPLSKPALLGTDASLPSSLDLLFKAPARIAEFGASLANALRLDIPNWTKSFTDFEAGRRKAGNSMLVKNASIAATSKTALKALLGAKVSIHGLPLLDMKLPRIELDYVSVKVPTDRTFQFAYVIYAGGFAKEAVAYAVQPDPITKKLEPQIPYAGYVHDEFWNKDRVFENHLGFGSGQPSVGILGSGDGALQDALRCLVGSSHPHPLAIWDGLMAHRNGKSRALRYSPHVQKALARVAAADLYTTGGAIWHHGTHVFRSLDDAFRAIIDDLYADEQLKLDSAIDSLVRGDVGRVTLVTQHGYFTKAYALNRFLVLLFARRFAKDGAGKVKLELRHGTVKTFAQIGSEVRGAELTIKSGKSTMTCKCDLVIIRGGLDRSAVPFQQAGLTGIDTGRAGLGRIPAPIRPVAT